MEAYFEKIKKIADEIEAEKKALDASLESAKRLELTIKSERDRLDARENDLNAKFRIVQEHENLAANKARVAEDRASIAKIMAELKAREEGLKEKEADFDKKFAEFATLRDINNKKIMDIKNREIDVKAKEEKLKSDFMKKLEQQLKG